MVFLIQTVYSEQESGFGYMYRGGDTVVLLHDRQAV